MIAAVVSSSQPIPYDVQSCNQSDCCKTAVLPQEIFKAVAQFVKEIQAGGPVQKGVDTESQADNAPVKPAVKTASTTNTTPSQVSQKLALLLNTGPFMLTQLRQFSCEVRYLSCRMYSY